MTPKQYVTLLLFCLLTGSAWSQADTLQCACCTSAHDAFDFWIGEWVVRDSTGQEVGTNSLVKLEKNCLLREQWKSALGGTGTSYNYYDPADSTWNQLWLDDSGTILKLKGQLEEGKMCLYSDWQKGQQVARYRNRITWEPLPDGSVMQTWDILGEGDTVLFLAFKGQYFHK